MKNYLRYSTALFFMFFLSLYQLNAAHIVGGDATYECLGLDTLGNGDVEIRLRLEFNMYRDNAGEGLGGGNGAQFDGQADFGIFYMNGNNVEFLTEETVGISINEPVPVDDVNPCIDVPTDVGVDRALYTFDIRLPLLTGVNESYYIAYQRCCRNGTITNLVDPGETGAVFSIEITSLAMGICNNSPRYNNFPPVVICQGEDIGFNHSATDVEGHQVFYEFCAPLTSGGTDGATTAGDPNSCTGVTPAAFLCLPPYDEVVFQLPTYSATNPIAGNPMITIDPITGVISGSPLLSGQYVVGVCAREIYNGQIMSVIRRDFQFNVETCDPVVVAEIDPDFPAVVENLNGVETIVSCGDNIIPFAHGGSTNDIISYDWLFSINGDVQTANTQETIFEFPGPGMYNVWLITNQGLECEARDSFPVLIHPPVHSDFSFEYDTCVAGPVEFFNASTTGANLITEYKWDFNGEGTSQEIDPDFQFINPGILDVSLIVTDNNECMDSIVRQVEWYPVPPLIVIEPNRFEGCAPASIFFNNLSVPIDSTYEINWNFGDGNTGDEISPTNVYNEVGNYDVRVEIISPIGCETSNFYGGLITVYEAPVADFSYSPDKPSVFNPVVNFFDNSIDAQGWQWDMSGEASFLDQNPIYEFRDTGIYDVQLIVRHLSGCTDTIVKQVDIDPRGSFHMPNAFTPNGDGTNDIFIGNGYVVGMREFALTIWNRWGEQVFISNDPYIGWDGTKNNSGQNSPSGVYVYELFYVDPRGEEVRFRGHATLIR